MGAGDSPVSVTPAEVEQRACSCNHRTLATQARTTVLLESGAADSDGGSDASASPVSSSGVAGIVSSTANSVASADGSPAGSSSTTAAGDEQPRAVHRLHLCHVECW